MKIKSIHSGFVLALIAAGMLTDASALTIGRARGAALLGQALDISVPVQYTPEEDVSVGCFEAEVFYGDDRIDGGRVTLSTLPATGPQTMSVRIQSAVKVDEPVVTVYLKAICSQKTSRKYVLLADLPSEPAPMASLPAISTLPLPALKPAPLAGSDIALPGASKAAKPVRSSGESGATKASILASSTKKSVSDASPVKRPRLKLTPMDGLIERDPILKSTEELLSAPVEDLQKRVEALATWRALNASAQDVLRDEARIQTLEGGMKSLTDVTAKNRQSLEEISNRLAESEAQRYANPVIYGLIAALLACFGGLAYLWNRRKTVDGGPAWWGAESAQVSLFEPVVAKPKKSAVIQEPNVDLPDLQASKLSATSGPVSVNTVDIDLGDVSAVSGAASAMTPATNTGFDSVFSKSSEYAGISRRDFSVSVAGALRSMNSKEMLDVCQQAEFFMALGRHDEAIAVLESGLASDDNANPLIYLDLLKLFHTLSKKSEFDHYRAQFNKLFTGRVPVYTSFHLGGNSLEAYPQVCAQIADLWPTSQAIEYIEFCLVRTPADGVDQGFDMEAFRDLLMLDAIAKQLDAPNVTTIAPFSAPASPSFEAVSDSATGSDRFGTPSTVADLDAAPTMMPALSAAESVDLDLSDLDGNLIDFDISNYEKSAGGDSVLDSIPDFNVGSTDEPAKRPG